MSDRVQIAVTNSSTGAKDYIKTCSLSNEWLSTLPWSAGNFQDGTTWDKAGFQSGTILNDIRIQSAKLTLSNKNYLGAYSFRPGDTWATFCYSDGRWLWNVAKYGDFAGKPLNERVGACYLGRYNGNNWFSAKITNKGVEIFGGTDKNNYIKKWLTTVIPEPIIDYPFGPESKPGGGGGSFDNSTDNINKPALPGENQDKLFFSYVYNPTYGQILALQKFLWSPSFSLDSIKKIFSNPIECITGLLQIPVKPKLYPNSQNIILGNIDTQIQSPYVSSRFASVDCGEIEVKKYWGNALDYSPYTNMSLYLPYIGYKQLDTNDVQGHKLGVSYTIDVCTGACVAIVTVDGSVRYQFSGECGLMYPITNKDNAPIYSSIIQMVAAGATMMSAGVGGSVAAAGAAARTMQATSALSTNGVALLGAGLTAANVATNIKPSVQRSGAISGACGFLGVQTPYLTIERPRQSLAHDYNKFVGYPSNLTLKLSDCKGFTQIDSVHLNGFSKAKAVEIQEIDSLLKGGVIL